MGRIRRAQSETFAIAEGQELIETLNSMFSFALGYNYTLVCPVGSDSNGKRWHSYNAPLRSRYKRQNWYDAHHISNELKQQLELLFPLFIKKYDEPDWRNTLRSIIYWYTTANQAQELEVAVVAIMSAFEKVIPRFSKLVKIDKRPGTTVENLNRILKYQHVAIDIPSSFRDIRIQINDYKDVHKNEPKYKDITSMIHLLAEARNSYIHEHYKLSRPLTSAEVLTLIEYGLEMIELLILSICAYQGKYVSRVIHKGTLVDVPWQNAATTS
jgi:hypothetical protein